MAEETKHSVESGRRASNAMVAAGLSSEDDAAVLGKFNEAIQLLYSFIKCNEPELD
jgi:hypothetical protein